MDPVVSYGRFLSWEIVLARHIFPFHDTTIEIGVGKPTNTGAANLRRSYHVCRYRLIPKDPHPENSRQSWDTESKRTISGASSRFQCGYWTGFRDLMISHGDYKADARFHGIQSGLHPIAIAYTSFGTIDLIPSAETPSFQVTCARSIVRNIGRFEDIDKLDLSLCCLMLLKKEWIRYHAIVMMCY